MERKDVSILIEISQMILENPRQMIFHPITKEPIEFRIVSYPKYGKLEIMLKEVSANSFYTVSVELEKEV